MSLLTEASLIVTPNAYKAGTLYSVVPNTTLGDMTVVRATSATRVNSAGLIEIARTNLVLQSQTFEDASWSKSFVTVTANTTTAPDGTTTADTITGIGALGARLIQTNSISFTASTSYSLSVFAKKGTNDFIQLFVPFGIGGMFANFNLNTGVVGTLGTTTGTAPTSSITNFGGGWYRCTMNFTATTTASTVPSISIVTSASAARAESNTLTTSVFLWGAQLEIGSVATEYIPTVASIRTKFAGITQDGSSASNIPRIDYSDGSCPSILVEPQRTNLALRSDDFSNASWIKGNTTFVGDTLTANAGTSFKSISQIQTTNGNQIIYFDVDYVSHQFFQIIIGTTGVDPLDLGRVNFDILNKTITQSITFTGFIKQFTGFTRIGVILPTTILKGSVILGFAETGTSLRATTTTSTGSVKLYRAQNELGSYPTSYIPTTAATVTRNADVISKTGISSLIGQTEGTFFCEMSALTNTQTASVYMSVFASGTNFTSLGFVTGTNKIVFEGIYGGVSIFYIYNAPFNININSKIAVAYQLNKITGYVNGIKVFENTTAQSFSQTLTQFKSDYRGLGNFLEANVKSIQLYKTALTDDQCILLTGPSFSSYPEMASALIYTLQ